MIRQLPHRTASAATATLLAFGLAPAATEGGASVPAGREVVAGAGQRGAPGPTLAARDRLRSTVASRRARAVAQVRQVRAVQVRAGVPARRASVSPGRAKAMARRQLAARGWSGQYRCLERLWTRESHWNVRAGHPARSYGIPQANPGGKMRAAGPAWRTDAGTQIRWGLGYIGSRYGRPCAAWRHWQQRHWY